LSEENVSCPGEMDYVPVKWIKIYQDKYFTGQAKAPQYHLPVLIPAFHGELRDRQRCQGKQ